LKNKIIALDIGGVCLNIRYDLCCNYFGFKSVKEVPNAFLLLAEKLETGRISETEWLARVHDLSSEKYSDKEIFDGWNMMISDEMPGMAKLIQKMVNANYRLIYFSDTSTIHIREVYRKLSFANAVTGAIFSFNVGSRKPAPEMYTAFENSYGKPDFYIDDRIENIKGGKAYGWNSHQFTSIRAIQDVLGL
jgi:putative hydrolase of the HAD superfamily